MPEQTVRLPKLSGSTDGENIAISQTATPGTTIHQVFASTTGWEDIELYACNIHTDTVTITIEYGGTTAAHKTTQKIPANQGWQILIPRFRLQNAQTIAIFASVANVININGTAEQTTP
jgi:hypothetical protein